MADIVINVDDDSFLERVVEVLNQTKRRPTLRQRLLAAWRGFRHG